MKCREILCNSFEIVFIACTIFHCFWVVFESENFWLFTIDIFRLGMKHWWVIDRMQIQILNRHVIFVYRNSKALLNVPFLVENVYGFTHKFSLCKNLFWFIEIFWHFEEKETFLKKSVKVDNLTNQQKNPFCFRMTRVVTWVNWWQLSLHTKQR